MSERDENNTTDSGNNNPLENDNPNNIPEGQNLQPINEPTQEETEEEIILPTVVVTDTKIHEVGPTEVRKKKNPVKKILLLVLLIGIGYIVYSIADIFVSPDRQIQQIYLVPENAAFIIQSNDPINDWQKFSSSPSWQTLKKTKAFEEISRNAEMLDSIVRNNSTLLSLVGKRDLLISIHKTRPRDFDALIILDLQKVSKMDVLKDQIETILKMTGSTVTNRNYKNMNILEMRNPETRDILYLAFVDNHVVLSFTSKLVEAAIDARENPIIGLNPSFIDVEKLVARKGLMQMYINYANIPDFMSIYMGAEDQGMIQTFCNSMEFAGLYFDVHKDRMETKGYTMRKETADPYITALMHSGKHKMKAHEIMSARTAFYTNIGFNNPVTFIKELETAMESTDKEMYQTYVSSRKKIESLFGLSLEENFFSWMSGEFAIAQSEPGLLGQEPELILAIRAKDIKSARKNMEIIEKKIKNRTPIKVKTVNYKDYEVNYVEMKGFFRLFFGGMFDKFEKPYYTYIDDYVVLSNKPSSLLSFVEDYDQKNVLKNLPGFKKAYSHFDSNSTFFLYADIHRFYPQLKKSVNSTTWKELQSDKDILYSFPQWGMQILGDNYSGSIHYVMNYEKYDPQEQIAAVEIESDEADEVMNEDAETEKELMNELERFYVEKFQGNVLRDFYPDGTLKSETEVKDGRRHGRYREYHENGKLKVRGKYSKNQPKGTWKYYTEKGEFERKEKY